VQFDNLTGIVRSGVLDGLLTTRIWSDRSRDNGQALRLIAAGAVPVADLITHRLPLERTVEGIHTVAAGEAIKVTIEA
jgi:threonine dehydrogenase-like Zn-dependent dehydrogenase